MNNKKVIISIVFVIILLTTFVTIGFNHFYKDNKETKKELNDSTKISVFFEKHANSGDYQEVVTNSWPTEGYTFNSDMSYCENDSELSWVNNKVVVKAYVKDKCFVYFDKVQMYYWNDGFSGNNYAHGNTPTTTYSTRELLANNYAQFTTNPIYIKTTDKHEACLYYNNHEFCFTADYWIPGDSDGTQTIAKLQTEMETALGTTANSCDGFVNTTVNKGQAYCEFGSFTCGIIMSGLALCSSSNIDCDVNINGYATCLSK